MKREIRIDFLNLVIAVLIAVATIVIMVVNDAPDWGTIGFGIIAFLVWFR